MKKICKRIFAALLCAVILFNSQLVDKLSFDVFAAKDEPYVSLVTNPKTAVVGETYSFDLFRFNDNVYDHHVTYKFFADSGMGYENDRYSDDQGFDVDDPYPLYGVKFESDGNIHGTPILKEETDRICIHFNAYVTWTNEQGDIVKEVQYNYTCQPDGIKIEDSSRYCFRLYIVHSSEKVVIPSDVKELNTGHSYLLTGNDEERWFCFTACAPDYEINECAFISNKTAYASGLDSEINYYPNSLDVYDSNGVPAGMHWIPMGGGGDDFDSGFVDALTIPGETYYVRVKYTFKFGFAFEPDYSRFAMLYGYGTYNIESRIETVDFLETKAFDYRSQHEDYWINDEWTDNTNWNVYRTTINWDVKSLWLGDGCATFECVIPFETEMDYYVFVDETEVGNYSAEDLRICATYESIKIYKDIVCFDDLDLTSRYTIDIYVFPNQKVVAEDGVLKVIENTEYEQEDHSTGIIVQYGDGCFTGPVEIEVTQLEIVRFDWEKYELDLNWRTDLEQMQAIYLIRMLDEAGNVVQPKAGHTVTLQIPIPHGCNFEKCRVAHILDEAGMSESFKWDPAPGSLSKPFTISENGKFFIIEVSSFSPFIIFEEETATLKVRDTKKTLPYGERRLLTADVENLLEGAKIVWTADNGNVELKPSVDGKTCEISAKKNGNVKIAATIVDKDGKPIQQDGTAISVNVSLKTKATLFHKLFYWIFRIPWPFG